MRITLGLTSLLVLAGAQACSARIRKSTCVQRCTPAIKQRSPTPAPVQVVASIPAWVTYIEGVAERKLPGGAIEDLQTATEVSSTDVIALGEGATLALLVPSGEEAGRVVTLQGPKSGQLSSLLSAAAGAEQETPAIPARLAAAVGKPWGVDSGEASQTRGGGGQLRALYPAGKVVSTWSARRSRPSL